MRAANERADAPLQPLSLTEEEEHMVRAVLDALKRIEHGSVQILVQDSRVVQIDTVAKTRFTRSLRIG